MEPERDMATGDYVVDDNGKMKMTTGLAPAIRARLRGHNKKWLHAPDDKWGSAYHRYNRRRSTQFSDGMAESIGERALQPMIDDGRMDDLQVVTSATNRGGVGLDIDYRDNLQSENYPVTVPIEV